MLRPQVTPLFQEVLEVQTEWMPLIKAAALTTLAVVQLLSTRPLVQSYLDSGFRQLHRLKQGTGPNKKSSDRIKAQVDLVHILFVKVRTPACFACPSHMCCVSQSHLFVNCFEPCHCTYSCSQSHPPADIASVNTTPFYAGTCYNRSGEMRHHVTIAEFASNFLTYPCVPSNIDCHLS